MNNKNKVRRAVREQIYIKHKDLFEKMDELISAKGMSGMFLTFHGQKIVALFREKIGYSSKTYDGDIFSSAIMNYRRRKMSGKAMYNSRKDEIK
jgi:hypothetical protein